MADERTQSRRETTPDEAMAQLRGERDRPAAVRAHIGSETVDLCYSRYGHIKADVWVDVLKERRTLPVTEKQAQNIVVSARRPDAGGITLELVPYSDSAFNDPRDD